MEAMPRAGTGCYGEEPPMRDNLRVPSSAFRHALIRHDQARLSLTTVPQQIPAATTPGGRAGAAFGATGNGMRRSAAMAAGLVLAAAILASCGDSGFTYVSSSSNNTYFKVPEGWRVFDTEEVVGRLTDPRAATSYRFVAVFDADPSPAVDRDLKTATHPFGIAQVRALTSLERDEYSLQKLRNEIVPLDTILNEDPDSIDLLETPEPVTLDNGLAGARHVYTIHSDEGAWTVHQTGVVDPQTSLVYFFIVGCQEQCYAGNESIINEVADSWTIKER